MATYSQKRKLATKRKAAQAAKEEAAGKFKASVYTAAALHRGNGYWNYPGRESGEAYEYTVDKIWVDRFGNIAANAGCWDCIVCSTDQIPDLIAFLQATYDGLKADAIP